MVVTDTRDRYLPFALSLDVPSDGLYAPYCTESSPRDADPYVPLYSAPARAVPAAMIVVRCDLRRESDRAKPAPWAWLELCVGSDVVATGMSDANGSALLVAPLPAPRERTFPLPLAPFDGTTWQISMRAYWHPARAGERVPDFCTVREQPEIGLLERLDPPSPLASRELRAGEPLALATAGSSYLYVAA
jgi:hypothetical protein